MSPSRKNKLHRSDQHRAWLQTHKDCLALALRQIFTSPLGAAMTIAVIGIALALPAGLSLTLTGIQQLGGVTEPSKQINVYLHKDHTAADRDALVSQLNNRAGIRVTETIDPDQALDAYKSQTTSAENAGFLDLLDENPLPYSLVLNPDNQLTPDQINTVVEEIRDHALVSLVQYDAAWSQQLYQLLGLLKTITLALSVLLILSVVLIVSNTVRVTVQSRMQEIQLSRQFGASRRFIQRPFLYQGMLFGFFGAIVASLLVLLCASLLNTPMRGLLDSFQISTDHLHLPYLSHLFLMLIAGTLIGMLTAWVMVSWTLKDLESRDFF